METRTPSIIDPHPQIDRGDSKKALRISGTSVIRRREPTNPEVAANHPNMVWDHQQQRPVAPVGGARAVGYRRLGETTMNRSGRPYALGTMVGGSPDDAGRVGMGVKPVKKMNRG
jgi:hypothetical protein